MKFIKNWKAKKKLNKELKENAPSSYKARIRWDDREWLVVENVVYKGTEYLYIVEDISEEIEKLDDPTDYIVDNLSWQYIYEKSNGIYKNVTDQKLISKLHALVLINRS